MPLFGHLSDKIGRRKMYAIGIACVALFAFPYFGLLNTTEPGLVLLAIVLSLVFHDMQYGPQAALIAESFGTNIRYSGAGLGYQLASVIAGGPAPLIAAAILARHRVEHGDQHLHPDLLRALGRRARAHAAPGGDGEHARQDLSRARLARRLHSARRVSTLTTASLGSHDGDPNRRHRRRDSP